jgi:hypothetical protein
MEMRVFVFLMAAGVLFGCGSKKVGGEAAGGMARFDSVVFRYLKGEVGEEALMAYGEFLDVYGERVIGVGRSDSASFYDRLRGYFSEPDIFHLYKDEQVRMADVSGFLKETEEGLEGLLLHFPIIKRPEVYVHVSGWGQNVVVTDSAVSISADKYLGMDYAMYASFFYAYQRQGMTPERMAPDALLGFLMANFPFRGREDVLADRILYEGKLRYFLSVLLPERAVWEAVGYSREQYEWCGDRGGSIWKSVLEQGHLFTPDYKTTAGYVEDAPATALLPEGTPGRVGVWLGFRIICAYMAHYPKTNWPELMAMDDATELLRWARF